MSFWHTLGDLLLPRHCAVCDAELGRDESTLCNVCLCHLSQVTWTNIEDNAMLRCLWNRHDVEAAGSAFFYNTSSPYHTLFVLLKYGHRPDVGRHLAQCAFPRWHACGLGSGAAYIVPVPLACSRQWRRGYNQSQWIAQGISRATGIPIEENVLVRQRNNPTQTHRTAQERQDNVAGIFEVSAKSPDLNGKTILLVDDIFTTGATLGDCVRALREAFPRVRIHLFTLGWAGER